MDCPMQVDPSPNRRIAPLPGTKAKQNIMDVDVPFIDPVWFSTRKPSLTRRRKASVFEDDQDATLASILEDKRYLEREVHDNDRRKRFKSAQEPVEEVRQPTSVFLRIRYSCWCAGP